MIEASVTIEVAARSGKALTRKAASESPTRAGKLAAAKPPAHTSATAKPPAVSTPTTVSTPASPAARERVSGQSPGESGSHSQNNHDTT